MSICRCSNFSDFCVSVLTDNRASDDDSAITPWNPDAAQAASLPRFYVFDQSIASVDTLDYQQQHINNRFSKSLEAVAASVTTALSA